jgi:hypothetical protein
MMKTVIHGRLVADQTHPRAVQEANFFRQQPLQP